MVEIVPAGVEKTPLNLMVFADSGAGKTVFSASAPRVLFIAPEDNGIISAVNMGYKFDKIAVRSWDDFVAAYEYCYDNIDELVKKYDWFAIDSITKMQEICMKSIVDSQRQQRISRDQDPDLPQIQDYQKLYILMEKLILAFNDLPVNVLYTALARNVEDPDGNEFMLPMIGSNSKSDYRVAMKCASHMTSYGYFKVEIVDKPAPTDDDPQKTRKVKQRVIYWEDTGAYRGKDRTTRMTPKTVLPPRNALAFISKVANGEIDRNGEPIKPAVPKSQMPASAKKATKAVPKGPNQQVREAVKAVSEAPLPNPANTPDNAADISDSVPQHNDGPKGESEGIELASVEA